MMAKQYGQFLKQKTAKPATEVLSWLDMPHSFADEISTDMPDPALTTGAFVFAFKGESILLAQVLERGWDIPGGHIERHETPEEAVKRELFEETGATPLLLGMLGHRKVTIEQDEPPQNYRYPFPESNLVFYWAVLHENIGQPTMPAEVGPAKFFMPSKAIQLDCMKQNKVFYNAALERAKVVSSQMGE